jgi:hypothetical protein
LRDYQDIGRSGFDAGATVAMSDFNESRDTGRAAFLIIALASAAMAAMLTGGVAHDEFGIPLDTIRTDALSAAGSFSPQSPAGPY